MGTGTGERALAWKSDAANRCEQDGRYIVPAIGRDYDDVPPMRGGFHGHADHEWTTTVPVRSAQSD